MKIALEAAEIQRKQQVDKENIKVDREKIKANVQMNKEDNQTDLTIANAKNKVEDKKIKAMVKVKKNNGSK